MMLRQPTCFFEYFFIRIYDLRKIQTYEIFHTLQFILICATLIVPWHKVRLPFSSGMGHQRQNLWHPRFRESTRWEYQCQNILPNAALMIYDCNNLPHIPSLTELSESTCHRATTLPIWDGSGSRLTNALSNYSRSTWTNANNPPTLNIFI